MTEGVRLLQHRRTPWRWYSALLGGPGGFCDSACFYEVNGQQKSLPRRPEAVLPARKITSEKS